MGKRPGQNYPQFQGPWYPKADIEIGRISANGAHNRLIFHANQKEAVYGSFMQGSKQEKVNRSPIRARMSAGLIRTRGVAGPAPPDLVDLSYPRQGDPADARQDTGTSGVKNKKDYLAGAVISGFFIIAFLIATMMIKSPARIRQIPVT
jgi:hypothetical protein